MNQTRIVSSILVGGGLAAVLDGLDAIVAFKLVLGLDPKTIYQFVASGMLGPSAFEGGIATALVGVVVHCLIALSAAALFSFASVRLPRLLERPLFYGALYGVAVYAFMNHVVTPLSLIPPSPFSLALFLNGVIGHALFVGVPIALATRHYLGASLDHRGQTKTAQSAGSSAPSLQSRIPSHTR
jgi:hypothetical protein